MNAYGMGGGGSAEMEWGMVWRPCLLIGKLCLGDVIHRDVRLAKRMAEVEREMLILGG